MPDLTFAIFLAAGKWDLVKAFLGADARPWRTKGGITVHTELNHLTKVLLDKILDTRFWDYFRPGQGGEAVAYDTTVWQFVTGYLHKLSDLQYRQVSGRLMPKFHATVAELARIMTGQRHIVVAIHMPLWNTQQRQKVAEDCLDHLEVWLPELLSTLRPGDHLSVVADWNISWKTKTGNAILRALSNAPGLKGRVRWGWDGHVDATDRARSLIDNMLTTLEVTEATLLGPVKSSDHQPVRFDCVMPAVVAEPPAPTPAPEPVPVPAPTPTPTPEAPVARQAKSLDVLLAEVNAHAPRRNKASDGGLGDPAHRARKSDHNPNRAGVWRARDFTNDPGDGFDANLFANLVARKLGVHPALGSGAYVIWNRRIISTDRLREGWRPYSGANPHNKHVHVSVGTSGYDSTAKWDVFRVERVYQPGERDLVFREGRDPLAGPDVKFVQKAIGMGTQDGYYGPKTAAQVKAWEQQHNARKKKPTLKADGIVGTGTWEALTGKKVDLKAYNK